MSNEEKSVYEESSYGSEFENSLSSQSTNSDYIPSQTPESEDYTSYESSKPLIPTESEDYTSYESSEPLTPTESEDYTSYESTPTDLKNS